jgi:pimeloyl-ACP methyl ester carboxylesterase
MVNSVPDVLLAGAEPSERCAMSIFSHQHHPAASRPSATGDSATQAQLVHSDASAEQAAPSPEGLPVSVAIPFPDGDLVCHVSGSGEPILLVHSINAAASAVEMCDLGEELAECRTVYNLDLPGFGDSERPAVRYDVARFMSAIEAAVALIAQRHGQRPVDAVALSLSAEFLARSATHHPELYRTLTFITPTGFQKGAESLTGPEGATLERSWLSWLLAKPAVGRPLYHALTLPASIRFFLERTFGSKIVDPLIYVAALRTSRVEGAEHAPLAFITGRLFSKDITRVYQAITLPVWLVHGTRGAFCDMSAAGWTGARRNWRLTPMEAGAMPHIEHPAQFTAMLLDHLVSAGDKSGDLASDGSVDETLNQRHYASL